MRLGELRASTRFLLAMFVLLIALVAMAVPGLRGLPAVDAASLQVFDDNSLTSEATTQLDAGPDRPKPPQIRRQARGG
jgi:hypothetical protein